MTPDYLVGALTTTGSISWDAQLPNQSSLAGIVFHMQMVVLEIGPSLKYATAKVNKASRSGGGGGGFGGGGGGGGANSRPADQPKDDPWGSAPASGSFGGADDEPPF